MKTRAEAVAFIERQFQDTTLKTYPKGNKVHYGLQDLRQLMDYIYLRKPMTDSEKLPVEICDLGGNKT